MNRGESGRLSTSWNVDPLDLLPEAAHRGQNAANGRVLTPPISVERPMGLPFPTPTTRGYEKVADS